MTTLTAKFIEDAFEVSKIVVKATDQIGLQEARIEAVKICIREEVDVELIFQWNKKGIERHYISWDELINSILVSEVKPI